MKKILLPIIIMTTAFAMGCFEIAEDIKNDQVSEVLLDRAKYAFFQYSDGTYNINFYYYASAWSALLPGYHTFGIILDTAGDPVVCDLWVKDGAIPGNYDETDRDTVYKIEYDNDAAGTPYVLDASQPFTFTLTANGPGRLIGTFSGTLLHSDAGSPGTAALTGGIFDLPYRHY
jgi:hypothetical protein